MAFCSAPGIRKEHSDAQSRGGAFRGRSELCAMLRINCAMRLYSVSKCGRSYNGGILAGALEEWRRGGPGAPPKKQQSRPQGGYPGRGSELRVDTTRLRFRVATVRERCGMHGLPTARR